MLVLNAVDILSICYLIVIGNNLLINRSHLINLSNNQVSNQSLFSYLYQCAYLLTLAFNLLICKHNNRNFIQSANMHSQESS